MLGIDFASIDGNRPPSWSVATDVGTSFVIVRGVYGRPLQKGGSIYVDPTLQYRDAIRKAGMTYGAYLFLCYPKIGWSPPPSPEQQAEVFCKNVPLERYRDFPPMLDVEFPGGRQITGFSAQEALDWTHRAWKVLKAHYGIAPGIYTSARVWKEDLDDLPAPIFTESPLWLAKPWPWPIRTKARMMPPVGVRPNVPPPLGDATNYWIYQYQGDAVGFPGFTSTVDVNRFHSISEPAKGDQVRWIQRRLGQCEGTPGLFDEVTAICVEDFQRCHGLKPDRIVGPKTFAALAWSNP